MYIILLRANVFGLSKRVAFLGKRICEFRDKSGSKQDN